MFYVPRSTFGQASLNLMKHSHLESEQVEFLLWKKSLNFRKTIRHWLWGVMDLSRVAWSRTEAAAARTRTWILAVRGEGVTINPLWYRSASGNESSFATSKLVQDFHILYRPKSGKRTSWHCRLSTYIICLLQLSLAALTVCKRRCNNRHRFLFNHHNSITFCWMDLLYSLQCGDIKRTLSPFVYKRLKVSDGILISWRSAAGYVKQENISFNPFYPRP